MSINRERIRDYFRAYHIRKQYASLKKDQYQPLYANVQERKENNDPVYQEIKKHKEFK